MTAGAVDAGRRALLRLAASLGTRDSAAIRAAMEAARDAADANAVDEVLLQSHLFIGFPDALNALGLWREVSGTAAPPSAGEDAAGWDARGERVCAAVYGANYEKLRINVRRLHPDVDGWMVTGGYGRVIGRPGLDLATRELCIASLLAVWNVPRQLHSHLRGSLNAGASVAGVDEAVEIACGYLAPDRAAEVRALWAGIRAKAGWRSPGRMDDPSARHSERGTSEEPARPRRWPGRSRMLVRPIIILGRVFFCARYDGRSRGDGEGKPCF